MEIVSPEFGHLQFDESTLINFPLGLPGFEHCRDFKLLHEDVPQPKVLWLHSLNDTSVIFSVVEASMLGLHYQITLNDQECAMLEYQDGEELVLLLTLSKHAVDGSLQPNTQSPILLNISKRKALQKNGLRAEIVFTNE